MLYRYQTYGVGKHVCLVSLINKLPKVSCTGVQPSPQGTLITTATHEKPSTYQTLVKLLNADLPSDVWAFEVRNLDRAPQKNPPEDRLRGICADADAIARRKVR
jgi:hypothetical protein